jgi:hypothetical protein
MRPLKHVDILAITCLLLGIAVISQVGQSEIIRHQSARLIEFTNREFLLVLTNPHLSKLCLTGD